MGENLGAQNGIAQEGLPGGPLIAEFNDARAAAGRAVGLFMGVPGIALIGVGLLAGPGDGWLCGVIPVVLGAGFFALGTLRKRNRLLVYSDGLVQIKRGKAEPQLWEDVHEVLVEQERTYHHLGMYKTVRNFCSLQRKDGTWIKLNAVPITGAVIKAIRQSRESAGFGWREGQDSWLL